MAKKELNAISVAKRVRPYIEKTSVAGLTLVLDETRIELRNGYWRVPVRPSREPKPMFPYFEALADIEVEVQAKEHIKVTIAAGDPIDA